MSSLVGRVVLGRYRVLCLLARGGMGEVYLARSEGAAGFFRPVVVKRVLAQHAGDKGIVSLFQREARIMSALRHPGIVSVLDFGEDHDDHVMVIEYVHGFHLGRWVRWAGERGEPFPVERAIQITLDVLSALEHLHEAHGADGARLSIVHRDVSPANVLVDVEGTVKLADFGIARMEGEHTLVDGSHPSVKGKFPYLAPELFEGTVASAATDVYAAAVVLDEVLRGKNAFRTGQMAETLARVLEHVPEPLDAVRRDVSADLAAVVGRAIDKAPESRYRTAAEFAAALRRVRVASPDEAKTELAAAARRDFSDPRMAVALELPPLAELEALWHGPAPAGEPPPPVERSSIPTAPAVRPRGEAVRSPRGRGRLAAAAVGALALAGIVAAAVWAATRPPPLDAGGASLFVVVDRTAVPDAGSRAAEVRTAADAAAVSAPSDGGVLLAASAEDEAPRGGRTGPRPVEAPFRARSGEIGRCFATHVRALEGTPELLVHFTVRADGTVERATLTPSEVAESPLGRCILEVATTTRFVARSAPVSFGVPLGARRAGGG